MSTNKKSSYEEIDEAEASICRNICVESFGGNRSDPCSFMSVLFMFIQCLCYLFLGRGSAKIRR